MNGRKLQWSRTAEKILGIIFIHSNTKTKQLNFVLLDIVKVEIDTKSHNFDWVIIFNAFVDQLEDSRRCCFVFIFLS